MNPKKVAARVATAGALGFGALGLGVGAAEASANPGECGDYCHVDYHGDRGADTVDKPETAADTADTTATAETADTGRARLT
jgi:hypothetical protein